MIIIKIHLFYNDSKNATRVLLSSGVVMKMFLIASFLFFSTAQASRPLRCVEAAKRFAFAAYKSECGGFGDIKDCETLKTSRVVNQKFNTTISCGFSGEPDYHDLLEMEILVDAVNCRILKTKTNECYTN
jgi:hypothetical protein